MQDIKIDLVYLWVNDKDKKWQEKRQYWAKELGLVGTEENNNCRFVDNDELKYSLRSAQMYAPWINKIFIVTDNQVPDWLDVNHPKIRIVDHKEIIPNEYLPCFNSEAIETCLANIPDLSEYFLCSCDDKFFSSEVTPDYFFDENNNPIVNFRPQNWLKDEIARSLYKQSYLNTVDVFKKHFEMKNAFEKLEPFHCIEAYRKSYYLECKNNIKEFAQTVQNKFRAQNSVQRPIVDLFMVENKNCKLKKNTPVLEQNSTLKVDNLYLAISSVESMKKTIKAKSSKLLCINDGDYIFEKDRANLCFLLEELYPQKQPWEKDNVQNFEINPIKADAQTIVFAFDNEYYQYFAVTLASLIENSNENKFYDIVVFHTDIEFDNQKALEENLPNNFSLRFVNVSSCYFEYYKNLSQEVPKYWTKEIYYRTLIPIVMQKYEKVLYLDSDIIINKNIDELFKKSFDEKQIIAVLDATAPVLKLEKNQLRYFHISDVLKLKDPSSYFNSGLILFNLSKIDKNQYIEKLKNAIKINDFMYPDQDILNVVFENNVKYISQVWNYCCGVMIWHKSYRNEIYGDFKKDFFNAHQDPTIIHYTSPKKPWHSVDERFFDVFWKYAKKTKFYEVLMHKMCKTTIQNTLAEEMKCINLLTKIATGKKIFLWGASLFLEDFINKYQVNNENVLGIIDKNICRQGEFLGPYKIFQPDILKEIMPEEIIITIVNSSQERAEEIKQYLQKEKFGLIEIRQI